MKEHSSLLIPKQLAITNVIDLPFDKINLVYLNNSE